MLGRITQINPSLSRPDIRHCPFQTSRFAWATTVKWSHLTDFFFLKLYTYLFIYVFRVTGPLLSCPRFCSWSISLPRLFVSSRLLSGSRVCRTETLLSAWTGAETPSSPLVRTIQHAQWPWPPTGPKPRTDTSWLRRWTTRPPPPRQTTSPKPWWWKCRRRRMRYPREKRGLGNLIFFSPVSDTQSDSEMSGDFLIYVGKTEEVIRNSWQFSIHPYT